LEEVLATEFDPNFRKEVMEKFYKNEKFYNCLACGMCGGGCVYTDVHEHMDPRRFIRKVLMGMKEEALNDPFVWLCTACERCIMNCPMEVNVAGVVRTIRGNFGLTGPGFLQDVADAHLRSNNQMDITEEDFRDTIEWMQEELQAEVDDPKAEIPIDKVGADFLYLISAREVKYFAQDIQNAGKIFYAAGANWTLSSKAWDSTNFGLFNGRDNEAGAILQRYVDAKRELKVKYVVVTECGHAIRSHKWGPKAWLGLTEEDYPVKSILEMEEQWIKEGRLKLDPTVNAERVTLHDPCNLVRKEGIAEAPRFVLRNVVMDFVEMWPNGKYNYCCGAGGGALAMSPYKEQRIQKGRLKAEQIRNTGAKVVACPCHNCFDQLSDINKHYELGVKIKHISHLLGDALIIEKK